MAELTAEPTQPSSCCSPAAQETCCEPGDKETCCATAAAGGKCGCSAAQAVADVEPDSVLDEPASVPLELPGLTAGGPS